MKPQAIAAVNNTPDLARELQAIKAALADRITIVHVIINPDRSVVGTYRKTVLLPRDPSQGEK